MIEKDSNFCFGFPILFYLILNTFLKYAVQCYLVAMMFLCIDLYLLRKNANLCDTNCAKEVACQIILLVLPMYEFFILTYDFVWDYEGGLLLSILLSCIIITYFYAFPVIPEYPKVLYTLKLIYRLERN